MKVSESSASARGSSLIEVIIAVGVLAVAIPLVFGALAESGKTNFASEAETRSTWIIPACIEEIRASREGRSRFFSATTIGQEFPPAGDIWCLAFSAEGTPLGAITKADYEKGIKNVNNRQAFYLATLTAKAQNPAKAVGNPKMLAVHLQLEYPAGTPAARRQKLDFYTRIP